MIDFTKKKRIVIKLGTSTLTHKTGKLNIRRMTNLVQVLSDLHRKFCWFPPVQLEWVLAS